jgi:hypothetical protein
MSGIGILSHQGTPGAFTMCVQYALLALKVVMTKVNSARTMVMAMFPVIFTPNGKNGINPIRLLKKIKKKSVSKYGI